MRWVAFKCGNLDFPKLAYYILKLLIIYSWTFRLSNPQSGFDISSNNIGEKWGDLNTTEPNRCAIQFPIIIAFFSSVSVETIFFISVSITQTQKKNAVNVLATVPGNDDILLYFRQYHNVTYLKIVSNLWLRDAATKIKF